MHIHKPGGEVVNVSGREDVTSSDVAVAVVAGVVALFLEVVDWTAKSSENVIIIIIEIINSGFFKLF
jgi:hypothetical protein